MNSRLGKARVKRGKTRVSGSCRSCSVASAPSSGRREEPTDLRRQEDEENDRPSGRRRVRRAGRRVSVRDGALEGVSERLWGACAKLQFAIVT